MARAKDIDSQDSQFCIFFKKAPHLDGEYTIWAHGTQHCEVNRRSKNLTQPVIKGMEYVDQIKRGVPAPNPDRIISMRVLEE